MNAELAVPSDALARLRAFQRQANWLRRSKLMQAKNVQFKLTLNFVPNEGARWEFEGFDNEHFLAVLPVLRQFVLNEDPVNLCRIHNIIMRYCHSSEIKNWVSYSRREWLDTLNSMPNKSVLYHFTRFRNVQEIVQNLFHGFGGFFHVDLKADHHPLQTEEVMLAALQNVFPRLWNCIRNVDSSITSWLDKPNDPVPILDYDKKVSVE
jgi:hypothetical protein